jgi:uridine kinase
MKPLVIGIAGGTGSGKTSVAVAILARLEKNRVVVLQHDSYYKDLSQFGGLAPAQINFDHPDSLETELLIRHVGDLCKGGHVQQPMYDFTTLKRLASTRLLEPREIVIIEGILIFVDKSLRDQMDIKIFIDADADERLLRRIRRDIVERGRSIESVMAQYVKTVKPMHLEFVEPSKHWADVIITRGAENIVAIDMVVTKIRTMMKASSA